MENKIVAIYTTFNPQIYFLKRSISILFGKVDNIIIVDNSASTNFEVYDEIRRKYNAHILATNGNTGIADALNLGCRIAIENGTDWAITMDQDSMVPNNIIDCYKNYLNSHDEDNIGALVPSFALCPGAIQIHGGFDEEVDDYMTSGSLVNLKAYQKVGGFNEKLFIDMVDTDYGLRLISNNYRIIRLGNVFMQHNIGNAKEVTLLGKHIAFITHHNYLRRYYITRNLLWLAKEYGQKFPKFNHPYYKIFKSIIRLLMFESDKKRKFKSLLKGINDYKHNRYGKY
ncbi:MAG: glycosyltransferase family 2 protein [Muribaculum sp.]|nr:glycosyltransferase family 2 protein [Muribaculum sp.]